MFIEQDWPCMSYELYVTAHITRTTIHFCPHIISWKGEGKEYFEGCAQSNLVV